MQGFSQPWQTKGAISPQFNFIQVAVIAVSITRIEIIMCVKNYTFKYMLFHFI